jgi:tetrapyrrole methylase family protein/MazG family protein
MRSQRLGEKAAKLGSDTPSPSATLDKLHAEFIALETEVRTSLTELLSAKTATPEKAPTLPPPRRDELERQFGDVLFSLCQLARLLGISAEDSLRACNKRFIEEFREQQPPAS